MWWNRDHSIENTGENGVFTFEGLTAGIYMIKETAWPAGYVQMSDNPIIRVNDDLSVDLLDSTGSLVDGNQSDMVRIDSDGTQITIIVGNKPGEALPYTGGPGTEAYLALGALMVVGAGMLLIRRKLKKQQVIPKE